ncbi:hypothetical protein J6590_068001, partial [Homalodisca vitripennis]
MVLQNVTPILPAAMETPCTCSVDAHVQVRPSMTSGNLICLRGSGTVCSRWALTPPRKLWQPLFTMRVSWYCLVVGPILHPFHYIR